MVKIIWGHGEKKNKKKNDKMPNVTREDVVSMPRLIHDWEPLDLQTHQQWRIPRADGNHLVITIRRMEGREASSLVSMYVGKPEKPASKRKARPDSSSTFPGGGRDTGQRLTTSPSGGQSGLPANTVRTGRPNVNFAVEQRENFSPAPEVAAHDEQAARDAADAAVAQRLDDMQAAGALDEESARALAESRDEAARAEHYDELGQSIIECIWNAGA